MMKNVSISMAICFTFLLLAAFKAQATLYNYEATGLATLIGDYANGDPFLAPISGNCVISDDLGAGPLPNDFSIVEFDFTVNDQYHFYGESGYLGLIDGGGFYDDRASFTGAGDWSFWFFESLVSYELDGTAYDRGLPAYSQLAPIIDIGYSTSIDNYPRDTIRIGSGLSTTPLHLVRTGVAVTPEPGTWVLLGSGLLGLIGFGRRFELGH